MIDTKFIIRKLYVFIHALFLTKRNNSIKKK